jgi:hypothetical protein
MIRESYRTWALFQLYTKTDLIILPEELFGQRSNGILLFVGTELSDGYLYWCHTSPVSQTNFI